MDKFIKAENVVHIVNPILAEFTLCGDAFDLASDIPGYAWEPANSLVTCSLCGTIIEFCRGVRVG